jgi:hypothetical protein
MKTVTAKSPARKPHQPVERRLRWLARLPGCKGAIRLALTYAKRTDLFRYFIELVPSDFGVAFRLEKIEPDGKVSEAYNVCVENDQDGHCDCKGFTYHSTCKHVDCCRVIAGGLS